MTKKSFKEFYSSVNNEQDLESPYGFKGDGKELPAGATATPVGVATNANQMIASNAGQLSGQVAIPTAQAARASAGTNLRCPPEEPLLFPGN
mgnify:CR=1 FL=1